MILEHLHRSCGARGLRGRLGRLEIDLDPKEPGVGESKVRSPGRYVWLALLGKERSSLSHHHREFIHLTRAKGRLTRRLPLVPDSGTERLALKMRLP